MMLLRKKKRIRKPGTNNWQNYKSHVQFELFIVYTLISRSGKFTMIVNLWLIQ